MHSTHLHHWITHGKGRVITLIGPCRIFGQKEYNNRNAHMETDLKVDTEDNKIKM
jgi:hypothetical protein